MEKAGVPLRLRAAHWVGWVNPNHFCSSRQTIRVAVEGWVCSLIAGRKDKTSRQFEREVNSRWSIERKCVRAIGPGVASGHLGVEQKVISRAIGFDDHAINSGLIWILNSISVQIVPDTMADKDGSIRASDRNRGAEKGQDQSKAPRKPWSFHIRRSRPRSGQSSGSDPGF
jgi:hypothetical protein